jgi:trehalose/maltose hydrolase-like predicted phosphorylase
MYPWESAETGVEETPVWALSGPFEHHITGMCWYCCMELLLRNTG